MKSEGGQIERQSEPLSSKENLKIGVKIEGSLSEKDLNDLKDTSKEAGDWVENKDMLEFIKKEELKNPTKIAKEKDKIEKAFENERKSQAPPWVQEKYRKERVRDVEIPVKKSKKREEYYNNLKFIEEHAEPPEVTKERYDRLQEKLSKMTEEEREKWNRLPYVDAELIHEGNINEIAEKERKELAERKREEDSFKWNLGEVKQKQKEENKNWWEFWK